MADIEYKKQALISAVREGNLNEVKRLTSELNFSTLLSWEPSFDILCHALKNKQLAIAKLLVRHGCKLKLGPQTTTALHVAVLYGDVDIIQMIRDRFENGSRVCSTRDENENGLAALHVFAHRRPVDQECARILDHLLKSYSKVNSRTSNGYIPLHYAAKCGNTAMILLLLSKNKTQINTASVISNYVPLHLAAMNGHTETVRLLLKKGAKFNAKTAGNETPLCLAIKIQSMSIIEMLLNSHYVQKPRSRISPFRDEEMLIYCAVESKNISFVDMFLKKGLSPNNCAIGTGKTPLHVAIEKGCGEIVKLLLRHGANFNAVQTRPKFSGPHQQPVGFTVLHFAAESDQDEIFKFLLRVGAKPNIVDEKGQTPLHLAAKKGSRSIVDPILNSGCEVFSLFTPEKENGHTPLHIAVEYGHEDLVKRFLMLGIPVNSKTKTGFIPIHLAAQTGNVAMVKLLLQFGANASLSGPSAIETPLFFAAQVGSSEIVEILSEISTNRKDEWLEGYASLYFAAYHGHISVAQILLQKGVDPNANFEDFLSPLHAAAQKGHKAIVSLLLEKGAEVNLSGKSGVITISTPLLAALLYKHEEIVEILLNRGADLNVKINPAQNALKSELEFLLSCGYELYSEFNLNAELGYTPIHLAANTGKKSIVEMVVKRGADVNSKTENNETPLSIAVKNQDEEIVEFLLESGSNADDAVLLLTAISQKNLAIVELLLKFNAPLNFISDVGNKIGVTPLHLAVMESSTEVIEALLRKGSVVDIMTEQDFPLHCAIKKRDDDIVTKLIEYGACVDSVCCEELTPLLHALKKGNLKVAQLILKKGASFEREAPKKVPLIHFAIDNQLKEDVIQFIVEFGADVNQRKFNLSPIQKVMKEKTEDLYREDRYSRYRNDYGYSPAYCRHDNYRAYDEDEDEDEVEDDEDEDEVEELGIVKKGKATYDHDKLLRLFLKYGFDVNTRMDLTGKTILHYACSSRNTKTVKILLQHDPDVNIFDQKGFTPFSYAVEKAAWAWNYFHQELCSDMYHLEEVLISPDLNVDDCDSYDDYEHCSESRQTKIIRNRDEYKKIARLMTQELAKLEAAGKEVHPENLVLLNKDTVQTYYKRCQKEITALKEKKITNYVSLFDILVASESQLANYAGNEKIITAMGSNNYISQQFPLYKAELKVRFNRGVERRNLLQMSTGFLKDVLKINFPDLIVDEIFQRLRLIDLKNLCRACSPFLFVSQKSA